MNQIKNLIIFVLGLFVGMMIMLFIVAGVVQKWRNSKSVQDFAVVALEHNGQRYFLGHPKNFFEALYAINVMLYWAIFRRKATHSLKNGRRIRNIGVALFVVGAIVLLIAICLSIWIIDPGVINAE